MNFSGTLVLRAPRERVFEALNDVPFFASCIDGVGELSQQEHNCYTGKFETKLAYMRFRFDVRVEIISANAPEQIQARIEGTPIGMVGRLTASSTTNLLEKGNDTELHYQIDAALTGKLGSIGRPVLNAKAKQMEKQFVDRLNAAFENGGVRGTR